LSIVNCSKYRFQSALEIGQTKPRSPRVYWREKRGNSLRLSRAKLPPVLYCCTTAHPMKSFDPSKNKSSIYNNFSSTPRILNMSPAEMSTSLSATGFAAFPAEIRAQIFWKTMDWDGTSPPLLKALRSTPVYYEALKVFYKRNTIVLGKENAWSFLDMPESVIRTIERLQIDIT
jgi:hypothetical protein